MARLSPQESGPLRRRTFISGTAAVLAARSFGSHSVLAADPPAHHLPLEDPHYRRVKPYIEEQPLPQYHWASPAAYEAFNDMKYGVRIHWGLYSLARFTGESWPYLQLSYAERDRYNQMYRSWNPSGFDADEWTSLFAESGMRMFAFTTKASPCSAPKHASAGGSAGMGRMLPS